MHYLSYLISIPAYVAAYNAKKLFLYVVSSHVSKTLKMRGGGKNVAKILHYIYPNVADLHADDHLIDHIGGV